MLHIEFDLSQSLRIARDVPGLRNDELKDSLDKWLKPGCYGISCISFDECDREVISEGEAARVALDNMNFNMDHHAWDADTVDYELHVLVLHDLAENASSGTTTVGLSTPGLAWSRDQGFSYLFTAPIDYYDLQARNEPNRKLLMFERLLHEIGHHMFLEHYSEPDTMYNEHSNDPWCAMGYRVKADYSSYPPTKYVFDNPANEGYDALATVRFCCDCYYSLASKLQLFGHLPSNPDTCQCPPDGQNPYPP